MVSTAAFHARVRGSVPGLGGLKETKLFLPHPRVKVSIVGSLRDREVACSASDRQGSNFESCVWRTVSSQSSHHSQEVLLAQFSLYVHKGGLKPDSFHFYFATKHVCWLDVGPASQSLNQQYVMFLGDTSPENTTHSASALGWCWAAITKRSGTFLTLVEHAHVGSANKIIKSCFCVFFASPSNPWHVLKKCCRAM